MRTIEISESLCLLSYIFIFTVLTFITIHASQSILNYFLSDSEFSHPQIPYVMIVYATVTGNNASNSNDDWWSTVNHDLYGTRSTNQTIINKENVNSLGVKWQIVNDFEIQDPPIVVNNTGYVQDYAGNVFAFDIHDGRILWNVRVGYGPTMGLTYDNGLVLSSTASKGTVVAINSTDGSKEWESEALGIPCWAIV